MEPTLIVLAAGMSTRYGRLKQLEPVGPGDETLLDYAVFDARRAGFGRMVFVIRREIEDALRTHLARRWVGIPVDFVYQELTQLPAGVMAPAGRTKPWGTAHAVLSASGAVEGAAFGVSNADDFYGAEAYVVLAAHLRGTSGEQALVGYRLAETLSDHGGVSRGVCEVDRAGVLRQVTEVHDLRRVGPGVRGRAPDGTERDYAPDAAASMNLWGFTPAIFPLLRDGFAAFLAARGADVRAEFPISTAVNDLVAAGRLVVRVVPTDERWMGVTFPEDRPAVVARLRALTDAGHFPQPLAAPSRAGRELG